MIVTPPTQVDPPERLGRVHFVGIGGAALSGLARLLVARGVPVSGSDAHDSPVLAELRALGIVCTVGHRAELVDSVDTVVVSTAVPEDNPEVLRARERGLRLWPRAAAVQSLLMGHRAIVVTGTHGKTTTTSMLVTALRAAGADPSYAVGSTLSSTGVNAAQGDDDLFVVEGDESDRAILTYRPYGVVVTNVDVDHLDFFGTPEAYAAVFDDFLARVQRDGFVVCGVDDPGGRRLAALAVDEGLRTITVGRHPSARIRAVGVQLSPEGSTCEVVAGASPLGRLELAVPGSGYVVDALAALAAGLELGLSFDTLAAGLAGFRGSGRRMEPRGERAGVRVVDSYAHHPVEIASDLEAARALAGGGRVVVCFQPHLFSRTERFAVEMGAALAAADEIVVLDVYPAREQPIPGVTGALVADAVPGDGEHVHYVPDAGRAPALLAELARSGDLVLTLGAGDVTALGGPLLDLLGAAPLPGRTHEEPSR